MNSASANIIRYNEQLKYARELAGDFASTLVSGLRNGEGLWKSLGKASDFRAHQDFRHATGTMCSTACSRSTAQPPAAVCLVAEGSSVAAVAWISASLRSRLRRPPR